MKQLSGKKKFLATKSMCVFHFLRNCNFVMISFSQQSMREPIFDLFKHCFQEFTGNLIKEGDLTEDQKDDFKV